MSMAVGPVTTVESVAVRPLGVVSVLVGPVTTVTVKSVALRLVEMMSVAVGPVTTVESVAVRPVEVVSESIAISQRRPWSQWPSGWWRRSR